LKLTAFNIVVQRLRFWLEDNMHPGMFSVNSAGDLFLRQPLDYEIEDFYSFLVHVTDGRTVSLPVICKDKELAKSTEQNQVSTNGHHPVPN
jgi:hypothetical protein